MDTLPNSLIKHIRSFVVNDKRKTCVCKTVKGFRCKLHATLICHVHANSLKVRSM